VQVILEQQRAALRRQLAGALGFACVCSILAVLVLRAVDEVAESTGAESTGVRLVVTVILALGYVVVFIRRYLGVPSFVVPSFGHLLRAWLISVDWRR
jgi:hypothetical protein